VDFHNFLWKTMGDSPQCLWKTLLEMWKNGFSAVLCVKPQADGEMAKKRTGRS